MTALTQLEGKTISKVSIGQEDSRCELQLDFTDGSDIILVFYARYALESEFMAADKGEPERRVVLVAPRV